MTDALVEAVRSAMTSYLLENVSPDTVRVALQAIEAAGYRVVSSEGIRQAVDAGLQGFCKDAPDFAMSPKMRQDAVDYILAQPLAAPRVGEG